MNKQLTQQNLDELMKQTLLNILSAKGIIYTYYKNNKLTKGNYANTQKISILIFNGKKST
jgi:hypothetical protein|tara:strand:- start:111 stop:290 length:180 start_codon:yes stop_codon:yes gene_type:complete